SPLEFFTGQIMMMNPFTTVVWISGLLYLLLSNRMKQYRFFAFAYIAIFAVLVLQNGKQYYVSPCYPILFAAGAIALETLNLKLFRPVFITVLLAAGLIAVPFAIPVLPVETYIRYAKTMGVKPESDERDRPGKLPQHYADMFG